jgi:hypothetical protein
MRTGDLVGHWPKTCVHCGLAWSAVQWRRLVLVDRAKLAEDAFVEMRHCACGEPLAAAVAADDSLDR